VRPQGFPPLPEAASPPPTDLDGLVQDLRSEWCSTKLWLCFKVFLLSFLWDGQNFKCSAIYVQHHEDTPPVGIDSYRVVLPRKFTLSCGRMGDAQRLLLSLICHSGLDPESSIFKAQRPEDRPSGTTSIEPGKGKRPSETV
jgi:hypothetical protein